MSISKYRRSLFATSLALIAAICVLPTAAQTTFPAKPIHFIVPYLPGGTTDIVARTVAQKVSEGLGQPVIVENRAGAGGNIGMDAVAKAAADGYTIGFGAISTNALNPHVYKSMAFDPRKDFVGVSLLGYSTIVLEVGADTPIKTVADLISAAKKAPGMTYGTAGAGTSMHLAGVLFALTTQTELTHVAYKGSMPGINDMMGGHIKVMFDNLPASLPHIHSGKLRALAVAGAARSPSLPDVPTLAEAGLKGYSVDPWFGVFAPANVPTAVLQKLNQAFVEALALPEVKEKLLRAGFTPKSSSAAELDALARTEFERLGKIARDSRMTAE